MLAMNPPKTAALWIKAGLSLLLLVFLGAGPRLAAAELATREAYALLENGEPAQAAEMLAELADAYPWRSDLRQSAGRAALLSGDIDLGIAQLEAVLLEDELTLEGALALGDAYQVKGDARAARDIWNLALSSTPNPPAELLLRMAKNERLLGNFEAATNYWMSLARLQPGNAVFQYELGLLLAALEPEKAMPYLEQAARLDADLAEKTQALQRSITAALAENEAAYTLLAAGRALGSLNEWVLAAEAFHRSTDLRPDYSEAWAFYGQALERTGRDGQPAFQKALLLDTDSLSANLLFGLYWQAQDEPGLALVYLYEAARIEPQNPQVQVEIGAHLARMGDLPGGKRHFTLAVEIAPRNGEVLRHLAEFSLQYNLEVRETALEAARQAVLINPRDPASLDVLGQVYFKLGDPASARRLFLRALQSNAGYAPAHLHLGLAYLLLGENQRAREHLLNAISLSPGTVTAATAERLLAGGNP